MNKNHDTLQNIFPLTKVGHEIIIITQLRVAEISVCCPCIKVFKATAAFRACQALPCLHGV